MHIFQKSRRRVGNVFLDKCIFARDLKVSEIRTDCILMFILTPAKILL